METKTFEIGKTYTKGNNEYQFRGMIGNDYMFWIRSNKNEAWENIKVLAGMNDILDNLK